MSRSLSPDQGSAADPQLPVIDRRTLLAIAGGIAATSLGPAGLMAQVDSVKPSVDWRLQFLDRRQALAVARLCEAIVPRTDTAGAIDSGVPEYIDLALSVEATARSGRFTKGLAALETRCQEEFDNSLSGVSDGQLFELLQLVSDERAPHAEENKVAAQFFADIKGRTVFGYYTSLEGRTQELGLPAKTGRSTFAGCSHQGSAGGEAGLHR